MNVASADAVADALARTAGRRRREEEYVARMEVGARAWSLVWGGRAPGDGENDMRGSIEGRSTMGRAASAAFALVLGLCAAGAVGGLEGGDARWGSAGKGMVRGRGAAGGKSPLGRAPGEDVVDVVGDGKEDGIDQAGDKLK